MLPGTEGDSDNQKVPPSNISTFTWKQDLLEMEERKKEKSFVQSIIVFWILRLEPLLFFMLNLFFQIN